MTTEFLKELEENIQKLQAEVSPKRQELAVALKEAIETSDAEDADEEKSAEALAKVTSLKDEVEKLDNRIAFLADSYQQIKDKPVSLKSAESVVGKEDEFTKLEDMFNSASIKSTSSKKRTIGAHVAEFFKKAGIRDEDSFMNFGNNYRGFSLKFGLSDKDEVAVAEVTSLTPIKSLYSNGGEEFISNGLVVPGFQGLGCSVYELEDECRLCCEPRTFADCLTVRDMPYGSVVQYDYPVSRDDAASGVEEAIYNPCPTLITDATKPMGTFSYATAKVKVAKIAHGVCLSDEVLEDCNRVQGRIDYFLTSGLERERDRQLIVGTGTGGEMLGITSQPGVVGTTFGDLTTGIDSPNLYDAIAAAVIQLERNCAVVDCIIINPADKLKVISAKDVNGQYLFPQNCSGNVEVCQYTLKTSPDVPPGMMIIGELKNNWIWFSRKTLDIRVGMTGNQFIENSKTILAEIRGTSVLLCPQKVAIVTGI